LIFVFRSATVLLFIGFLSFSLELSLDKEYDYQNAEESAQSELINNIQKKLDKFEKNSLLTIKKQNKINQKMIIWLNRDFMSPLYH